MRKGAHPAADRDRGAGLRWMSAAGVAALALFAAAGPAPGAPQTFNTALPVAQGEFVFREQFVLEKSGDDPSGAGRDRTAWSAVSVIGYGVNADLALFGVLPYVDKRLMETAGGARRDRSARGPGDVRLFGRYTVYKYNFRVGNFRVAPFAGIEAPTGDHAERDSFGRLPASVQPGSGSWDPFAGIVATYQVLDFQIDAQASYQANTEGGGFAFGDVARLDSSVQYRLWPRHLGARASRVPVRHTGGQSRRQGQQRKRRRRGPEFWRHHALSGPRDCNT